MPRKKTDLSTTSAGRVIDIQTRQPVVKPDLPLICERVRFYRQRMGIEQKELARRIGITGNAVCNWENGRSRPDVNLLPAICDALGITLYDLYALDDPTLQYTIRQQLLMEKFGQLSHGHKHVIEKAIDNLIDVELAETCPDLTTLTYFSRRLAAGIGDSTEFDDEGEEVYVYTSPDVSRADCIFTVNGNSMEPEFRSGQDVLVQRLPNGNDLRPGEIAAFVVRNETYIKEYQEDGLHSLNPDYPTMRFADEESVYLIGRVLGILDKASYAKPEDVEKYRLVHDLEWPDI